MTRINGGESIRPKMTSSSAMAKRPSDESAILRGCVTFRLNFTLNGYVSRQYLWTAKWENGYYLYYNFTAGSFYTKKLCSKLHYFIPSKLNFIQNRKTKQKIAF